MAHEAPRGPSGSAVDLRAKGSRLWMVMIVGGVVLAGGALAMFAFKSKDAEKFYLKYNKEKDDAKPIATIPIARVVKVASVLAQASHPRPATGATAAAEANRLPFRRQDGQLVRTHS